LLGEPKGARGRRALILVENLSVPFDRRVWQECRTLRDAGWEVDVICPRGAKRDTEPEAVIDGVRIHRYPLRAATGGPAGYLKEYGAALWHTARLARKVGPVDVVHACNPPDLLFLPALRLKRQGARFVFDQHDLVPELYLSRFGRGKDLLYRGVCALERMTYRAADVVLATNESYKDVAVRRGGRRPEDVFVVRSAPDTERFHPVEPEPELRRGKPHLLCYLGVMGPQDGVDYALRALATGTRCSSAGATPSTRWWRCPGSWGSRTRWSSRDGCRTPTWCATCPPRTCASPPTRATRSTTCRP
jgi:glycosyltransferase involved in cell wall biosynthesis